MPDQNIDNSYRDLHRFHTEGQTKYVYFLLAAAASGIGLTTSLTSESTLQLDQIPLGLAVVLWGLSFFFGARAMYKRNVMYGLNAVAIDMARKKSISTDENQSLYDEINDQNSKASKYVRWQFYLLVAGAIAFITWHVVKMYIRTMVIQTAYLDAQSTSIPLLGGF